MADVLANGEPASDRMRLLIVLLGLGLISPAAAQERTGQFVIVTGEELTKRCREQIKPVGEISLPYKFDDVNHLIESNMCSSYIHGVLDADRSQIVPASYCLPGGVRVGTVVEVVGRYLDTHPEQRHLPAIQLVRTALRAAYPC